MNTLRGEPPEPSTSSRQRAHHRAFHAPDGSLDRDRRNEWSRRAVNEQCLERLVALAFVGTLSRIGPAFYVFGLLLLPSLVFLGLVTFERAIQATIEDLAAAQQISRIRRFYFDASPHWRFT